MHTFQLQTDQPHAGCLGTLEKFARLIRAHGFVGTP